MDNLIFSLFRHEGFYDLSVYQFGYEKCRPNYVFGPAVRSHYLFHYIISGKGFLMSTVSDGSVSNHYLGAGKGFMLWPGQNNTYIADEHEPWEYAWIEFDGLQARELLMKAGFDYNHPVYSDYDAAAREAMKEHLLFIITHADNPPLELMGHFYLFAHWMIVSSAGRKQASPASLQDFYVQEAVSYIEQHYFHNITINDIAKYCNLHRSYLCRIFKEVLDISPQQFLIGYRMKKACELLKMGGRSIGEISTMVGYPNPLNFSRAFKREIGASPQQYKNENSKLINNG